MQQRIIGLMASLLPTAAVVAPTIGNAQDIQERTLKFPSASNKGHPQVMGVQKFAELVEEKSGGKTQIWLADPPGSVLTSYVASGGKLVERSGSSITEGV